MLVKIEKEGYTTKKFDEQYLEHLGIISRIFYDRDKKRVRVLNYDFKQYFVRHSFIITGSDEVYFFGIANLFETGDYYVQDVTYEKIGNLNDPDGLQIDFGVENFPFHKIKDKVLRKKIRRIILKGAPCKKETFEVIYGLID